VAVAEQVLLVEMLLEVLPWLEMVAMVQHHLFLALQLLTQVVVVALVILEKVLRGLAVAVMERLVQVGQRQHQELPILAVAVVLLMGL
jgi:hypothetical protein